MPKLKTESIPSEGASALHVLEPLDPTPVSKPKKVAKASGQTNNVNDAVNNGADASGTVSAETPTDGAKKSKAKAPKSGERKPRAKSKSAKQSPVAAKLDATEPSWNAGSGSEVEQETEQTLDFSVINDTTANTKRRGHSHENGVLCEFCKLDDEDFAAAYNLLKNNGNRRKQSADLDAIQTPVFIAAPDEETVLRKLPKKMTHLIGALVALAAVALVWTEESSYTRATSLSDFGNQTFTTPDRDGTLKFLHNSVALSTKDGGTSAVKARRWQDNWRDQLSLVFNKPEQTLWLKALPQGFQAQDGSMFYAKGSAEMKVIDSMMAVRDGAEKMFQSQGHYPTNPEEVAACSAAGAVAVSKVNVNEEISSNLVTNQGETSFEHALKGGQKFSREKESPNSVSCLEIKSEPSISSDFNSYGWKTNAFFMHGFDNKGQLIRGADGNPALLIGLKNGKRIQNLPDKVVARPSQPTSVWIYSDEMPNENNIRFSYLAVALLAVVGIAATIVKKVNDNVMGH